MAIRSNVTYKHPYEKRGQAAAESVYMIDTNSVLSCGYGRQPILSKLIWIG